MSGAPGPNDRRALLKEALAAVEQMQAKLDAVSYTHLTLPTN